MKFETMPRMFPTMEMWGAVAEPYTFVISQDGDEPFLASVKRTPSQPFRGQRTDLGMFDTLDEAVQECEHWLKRETGR